MQIAASKRRGIALLEGVIAIGVIMAGVVGTLVLINTTISLGRANQDRIVAQNLAREGMELAYAHRNAGSLSKVDFPTASWDMFLAKYLLKTGQEDAYKNQFDLGDLGPATLGGPGPDTKCRYYANPATGGTCQPDDDNCTTVTNDDHVNDDAARQCDMEVFTNYVFKSGAVMPPACSKEQPGWLTYWDGTEWDGPGTPEKRNCDFNHDGSLKPDASDVGVMVYNIYLSLFGYQAGYPTIALQDLTSTTKPVSTFEFYVPDLPDITGVYNIDTAWSDPQARVFEWNGTFIQNVSDIPNPTPTKFYRMVTFQPVCRRTDQINVTNDWVIDQNSVLNCQDSAMENITGDPEAKKIGVFVTSEVRWPTPTSATHVSYQEYLYDWINL
jgi:Tfp pilus assembly protein PilV